MLASLLKTSLRGFAFGLALMMGVVVVPAAYSASVSLFTGPAGTNPVAFPAGLNDLNTLINTVNANVFSWLNFNNSTAELGEAAFTNSLSFAGKANCGPSAGTIAATCLTIVDSTGRVGFIVVE